MKKIIGNRIALFLLVAALMIGMAGCAAPSTLLLLPVTGATGQMQVQEYALVEQSVDNPTHVTFQQRVTQAVAARQSGWHFPGVADTIDTQNRLLAPFGYRLAANPTPPFSGYALYSGGSLIYRDIQEYWPVSLKDNGGDFLLAFQTMNGDKLMASGGGVKPWPSSMNASGNSRADGGAPAYFGDQVAFAETSGSEISVYAGANKLYSGAAAGTGTAHQISGMQTWGKGHWGVEVDGHLILDGQDLNQAQGYDDVLFFQVISGQPLYIYSRGGQVLVNYAGHNLAYTYDRMVHGDTGSLAIFNPGSNGRFTWFYALRDGLWYYVELSAE